MKSPFVTKTREPSGTEYVTLADNAPKWLYNTVRDAHQGDMPNDWIFQVCKDAYEAEDLDPTADGAIHEFADSSVDIYTKDLYQWAADMCLTSTYSNAQSNAEDFGQSNAQPIKDQLKIIQYCAIAYIAEVIANAKKEG